MLKQVGSIREYIKDVTNLVLEIPGLSDKNSLFNFMNGLQPWTKTKLRRRGVQNLATVIAIAESLIDCTKESMSKVGEAKDNIKRSLARNRTQSGEKTRVDKRSNKSIPYNNYFFCGGPH